MLAAIILTLPPSAHCFQMLSSPCGMIVALVVALKLIDLVAYFAFVAIRATCTSAFQMATAFVSATSFAAALLAHEQAVRGDWVAQWKDDSDELFTDFAGTLFGSISAFASSAVCVPLLVVILCSSSAWLLVGDVYGIVRSSSWAHMLMTLVGLVLPVVHVIIGSGDDFTFFTNTVAATFVMVQWLPRPSTRPNRSPPPRRAKSDPTNKKKNKKKNEKNRRRTVVGPEPKLATLVSQERGSERGS